jgi:hypothetical protein
MKAYREERITAPERTFLFEQTSRWDRQNIPKRRLTPAKPRCVITEKIHQFHHGESLKQYMKMMFLFLL